MGYGYIFKRHRYLIDHDTPIIAHDASVNESVSCTRFVSLDRLAAENNALLEQFARWAYTHQRALVLVAPVFRPVIPLK